MTKSKVQVATGAAPAAAKPSKANSDGQIMQIADGRLLKYAQPLHIVRTLSDRGGPWSEQIVATSVANLTLSKMLQNGLDLLYAQRVQVVSEGVAFMWILAKPVGHSGKGLKEIMHMTRTVVPGMSATPPAVSAARLNDEIGLLMENGWMVFNFLPLTMEPSGGIASMWILVR